MQDPWYGYRTNDNHVLLGERGENLALDPKSHRAVEFTMITRRSNMYSVRSTEYQDPIAIQRMVQSRE